MDKTRKRIGVLAGWHVYGADAPEQYLLDAYRGIVEAATKLDCDVLFACGIAPTPARDSCPALPFITHGCHFVPIGTFNTDGLILLPPFPASLSGAGINELIDAGKPVIFLGQPGPGSCVISDAESGLASAIAHLKALGHTDIAFVAGNVNTPVNYSTHRQAFDEALRRNALCVNEGRVAYGQHTEPGGHAAIQDLLTHVAYEGGSRFSAVIVDGDASLDGAMRALREAGLRVPDDMAVIAYSNSLQAQMQTPAVTVLHQQVDEIGRQATHLLVEWMTHQPRSEHVPERTIVRVPERLIVRQSCGARLLRRSSPMDPLPHRPHAVDDLARHLAFELCIECDAGCQDRLTAACRTVIACWQQLLQDNQARGLEVFLGSLVAALKECAAPLDTALAWHSALSAVVEALPNPPPESPSEMSGVSGTRIATAIHHAHLAIAQHALQQQARRQQAQLHTIERMSVLSAQLLSAKSDAGILNVVTDGLQQLGTHLAGIALLDSPRAGYSNTQAAQTRFALWTREGGTLGTLPFEATAFPPDAVHVWRADMPAVDGPTHLAIIPFEVDGEQAGLIAMGVECLALGGAIVRQIASAIRNSQLYDQLARARMAADKANRMNPATRALVKQALAYIHTNYAGEITRDHIAAHVGIHSDYLTHIFHCETGLTPIAYRNRYRIAQASRLIESGYTITDAALAVGFADLSYFSRIFKREIGLSPQSFRQQRSFAARKPMIEAP